MTLREQTERLATKLGHVTVVCKGQVDFISDGRKGTNGGHIVIKSYSLVSVVECATKGSPRRVSGQGDILSGSMGLFLFWTKKAEGSG